MATPKRAVTPAPHATTTRKEPSGKAHVPLGRAAPHHAHVDVMQPTVHNWVQLVYEAFGVDFPTDPHELALLGVRTARHGPSRQVGVPIDPKKVAELAAKKRAKPPAKPAPKPAATPAAKPAVEKDTDADVEKREEDDAHDADQAVNQAKEPIPYGDLLYATSTPSTNGTEQSVQVFECHIDDTKLKAPVQTDAVYDAVTRCVRTILPHVDTAVIDGPMVQRAVGVWQQALDVPLPDLLEGKCFWGRLGSYLEPSHPGKHVLRLKTPRTDTRPEDVLRLVRSEMADWQSATKKGSSPAGSKYEPGGGNWCAPFVTYCMKHADPPMSIVDYMWTPDGVVAFMAKAWGLWIEGGTDIPEPGDVSIVNTMGTDDGNKWFHTGVCADVRGLVDVDDIEGNTGPHGGSPTDGKGHSLCQKPRKDTPNILAGFGRPRWAPIIRWGDDDVAQETYTRSDGLVLHRATVGHTVLHHHYYAKKDASTGRFVDPAAEDKKPQASKTPKAGAPKAGAPKAADPKAADPKAADPKADDKKKKLRYQVFLDLVEAAPKAQRDQIPYLVVSTNYVLSYPEWAELAKTMTPPLPPKSVIRKEGLVATKEWPDRYLPSFLTLEEANAIIAKCKSASKDSQAEVKRIDEQLRQRLSAYERSILTCEREAALAWPAHAKRMLAQLEDAMVKFAVTP